MSTPDATGTGRPLRTAGIALLAIAGISLLIALVTWLDGGGNGRPTAGDGGPGAPSSAAAPPSATPTATASDPVTPEPGEAAPATPGGPGGPGGADRPGGTGQPGVAGQPGGAGQPDGARPPAGGATAQPGGEARPAPAPNGEAGASSAEGYKSGAERAELRVYNNSTIRGLAARAADDFRSAGWPVIEVGNYSGGTIPTSTVYYQPGTGQRDPAGALGEEFELRVEPRFAGIRDAPSGVIVIVTNDYRG